MKIVILLSNLVSIILLLVILEFMTDTGARIALLAGAATGFVVANLFWFMLFKARELPISPITPRIMDRMLELEQDGRGGQFIGIDGTRITLLPKIARHNRDKGWKGLLQ